MTGPEKVVQRFCDGSLCSQAVISVYGPQYGLDAELGTRLATGFGGGIARTGETCGAVNGAIMVLGLAYGPEHGEEREAREAVYDRVRIFRERFLERHGSLSCRELLGRNIGDPEELERMREENLFRAKCPVFLRSAGEILESLEQEL